MLTQNGFNLWADGYDKSVGLSDENGTYPFAGYRAVLNEIYNSVLSGGAKTVLDIGFGTGTLTSKLYEQGCEIFGQDFSERMIELAKAKMPEASLYHGDFSQGLVNELRQIKYDAIIATYSLHHLPDDKKPAFISGLRELLNDGGCIYIGDVLFETRVKRESCRTLSGDEWDDDEFYIVFEEIRKYFPEMSFKEFSHCAGVITLKK